MLDIKFIRENLEQVKDALKKRNMNLNLDNLIETDNSRRKILLETEDLRAKQNKANDEISALLKQKKDAESQRLMQEGSGKECCRCGVYVRENIRCVSCGSYFCPDCYRDHQSIHSKPRIGISYHSNGSFSGYD